MILAHPTPQGIKVQFPDGTKGFIPERQEDWDREQRLYFYATRLTTAQRVGRHFGIDCRTVRVVRHTLTQEATEAQSLVVNKTGHRLGNGTAIGKGLSSDEST